MKSTDDNDKQLQYSHLCSCKLCRMNRTAVDFHPSHNWDASFCFDLMLTPLQKCILSRYSDHPTFNNAPLVNQRYEVDNNGGIFIVPGKSSHSTVKIPRSALVKFRENAGAQPASCFLLLKLTSSTKAGKGANFVRIKSFYQDADKIINSLKRFQQNTLPLAHFNKAVSILKPYCRKAPSNIVANEKLSVCGINLYNEIYNNSNLKFCSNCTDCTINNDLIEFTVQILKLYISLSFEPNSKLTKVFGREFVNAFLDRCDKTPTHATLKTNQNFIFPLNLIE